MKILEIYKQYTIPPNLQIHMFRVAAVASVICDNFEKSIDKQKVISACLLHDMGNIVKFKLDKFPEFLEPQGLKYWQEVQSKFIEKYGQDDHNATHKIVEEIGVSKEILKMIDSLGFANVGNIVKNSNFGKKVCVYSDMRVFPFGIASLEERLSEAKERYAGVTKAKYSFEEFNSKASKCEVIENQIFMHCKIKPSEITDRSVQPIIEELKDFILPNNGF